MYMEFDEKNGRAIAAIVNAIYIYNIHVYIQSRIIRIQSHIYCILYIYRSQSCFLQCRIFKVSLHKTSGGMYMLTLNCKIIQQENEIHWETFL